MDQILELWSKELIFADPKNYESAVRSISSYFES